MMWSFINGFLAVPFGIYESWIFFSHRLGGLINAPGYVREIWLERTLWQVVAYIFGQLAYISLPLDVLLVAKGNSIDARCVVDALLIICPGLFAAFTVFTLFVPVGAAKRYQCLGKHHQTGYERLFLGQMPPDLLFAAKGDGLRACLWEAALYLILIMLGAGMTQFCVFGLNADAFHFDASYGYVSFHPSSILMFVYFSVMTIFTVGYGDIAPVEPLSQYVSVCEVILGWMYLGAFFPALVGLTVEHRDEDLTATDERYQKDAVSTAVHHGVRWLVNQQLPTGEWRYRLTPDLLATSATFAFFERDKEGRLPGQLLGCFEEWFRALKRDEDFVGSIFMMTAQGSVTRADILMSLKEIDAGTDPEEHCAMIVAVFAVICGVLTLDEVRAYFPSDVNEWEDRYGSHWNCYGLLARLLIAQITDGGALKSSVLGPEALRILSELRSQRAECGSWYRDILLTSLISTTLLTLKIEEEPWEKTKQWLYSRIDPASAGLPLVDGLSIWDTAWGVAVLLCLTGETKATRNGIDWIISKQVNTIKGLWSWSDGSILPCNDTTSLVCEVLRQTVIREVTVDAVIRGAEGELAKAASGHQYSTFGRGTKLIHHCPIISARCTRISHARNGHERERAEKIFSDILSNTWTSYWFADPSIIDGLTLYYLAQVVSPRSTNLTAMVERLCQRQVISLEGAASSIMGLQEASNSIASQDALKRQISRRVSHLTDYVLSRQDGHSWRGDPIGVFGFGRRYADSIFATSLALLALERLAPDTFKRKQSTTI